MVYKTDTVCSQKKERKEVYMHTLPHGNR